MFNSSGSAFNNRGINKYYILSTIPEKKINNQIVYKEKTNYVNLTDFCNQNNITKKTARNLIRKKFLICQRLYGKLWVCVNPLCEEQLKSYLLVDEIKFDAIN